MQHQRCTTANIDGRSNAGRLRFSAQGEFLGFVGSVIDVHERRLAEEKLRASEERHRAVVESQAMVCRLRANGSVECARRSTGIW